MRIGIYNPYLAGIGGGERYTLTLAQHWSQTHKVYLFWNDTGFAHKALEQYGLDLTRVRMAPNVFGSRLLYPFKLLATRFMDALFILSDGSAPDTLAGINIIHFQFPFARVGITDEKLARYRAVVCNSRFTKTHLDPRAGRDAVVIYPPVRPVDAGKGPKEKVILSVGRFSPVHSMKKHEMMIEAFGQLHQRLPGWKLMLAGGVLKNDIPYLIKLRRMSSPYPVTIFSNISRRQLEALYGRAAIYWHAAGYGETDPVYMEHFGISTVEAMSAGCVPVVFAGGGQKEIVEDGQNGFLWKTPGELVDKTLKVVGNPQLAEMLADAGRESVRQFNEYSFCDRFDRLLARLVSVSGRTGTLTL